MTKDNRTWGLVALLAAAAGLALGCGAGGSSPIVAEDPRPSPAGGGANRDPTPSPDCAVYQAVLEQEPLFASASGTLVVRRQTSVDERTLAPQQSEGWAELWALVRSALPDLEDATVASYLLRNRESVELPVCPAFAAPVVTVDYAVIEEIFRGGWWPDFYQRFPGSAGLVELSRPGFSDDGRQAFVYASLTSDGRAGEGLFLLYENDGGRWKLAGRTGAWIA